MALIRGSGSYEKLVETSRGFFKCMVAVESEKKIKNKVIKTIKLPKTWLELPNIQNGSAVPSSNIRWVKLEQNFYANCTTGTTLNDRE